ncbi:uncharacterized protein LOC123210635 isoform X2 [Mangifera indica]|uniref:uncharacterized protein LOC123210635 isoform X2 n=1 Tax=Mangifera indica TaxID=29780 RepID=UPI001CFA1336|nr:uncharacterized protein LOC123210635 isoform X2 [Mangifera indica]
MKMGIDKDGSKSGGHVGGFFQLFDWKAKSRKKLFSSKSDFPERSKQGKKSDGTLPMTRLHLIDEDEAGAGESFNGSSDYSCASSVTDDDRYGARAPGVVARLMGLDSLPISSEPHSTPFFDTLSLQDAHCCGKNPEYHLDHQIMHSGHLLRKVESDTRDFLESKAQRMRSRPIEKFQTEILPAKSAKSIPITHHKLLSPIKSHSFISTKSAAHIMEAAVKIIEPGPQADNRASMAVVGSSSLPLKVRDLKEKAEAVQRMPLVGSSAVPLKVKDLKEKVGTAHKTTRLAEASLGPVEINAAKCLKGQSLNKSWNGSVDTTSFREFDAEEVTSGVKNKEKSISLAIQAKVNVQKREGLNSSSSRNFLSQKQQSEVKSSQPFKSQGNIKKNLHKRTSVHNSPSGVLRQNNQKQNCVIDRDRLASKPLASGLQSRKMSSGDLSTVRQKTLSRTSGNSKTGTRKLDSDVSDSEKGISYSNTKNVPRKKRSIERDSRDEKNQFIDNMLINKSQKAIKSSPVLDRHFSLTEDGKKKCIDIGHSSSGMDVVSFTFTAPLIRSMPGSETSCQVEQKKFSVCTGNHSKRLLLDTDCVNVSSLGYNVIGGDALSMLLEQKLTELSQKAESSHHDSFKFQDKEYQHVLLRDKRGSQYEPDFSSSGFRPNKFQGIDEMDECSSSHLDGKQLLDCQHPSPVSILKPSFSTESCNSSDTADSSITEGSKQCSSIQAQEFFGLSSLKKYYPLEADTELSDSASSTSTGTLAKMNANTTVKHLSGSAKWELEYVKQILCNIELMFKDFALGRARDIINPYLFDLLETRKLGPQSNSDESRLNRKVLFDCVSECMDLRCRRYVGGGCRTWIKGVAMVRRKESLAKELHKEISGWRAMGDCMVDELVGNDMSSQYGKWLDFEVDTFVLGVEVEGHIFNCLIDEVVADIFQT